MMVESCEIESSSCRVDACMGIVKEFIPTTTMMMSLTGMTTTMMTMTTSIRNNQPCGQMHFRLQGEEVILLTKTIITD
jgi:hypothetical protein